MSTAFYRGVFSFNRHLRVGVVVQRKRERDRLIFIDFVLIARRVILLPRENALHYKIQRHLIYFESAS